VSLYADEILACKRDLLARHLRNHRGNVSATAQHLGIQRTYLWRLIRRCDLGAELLAIRRRRAELEAILT
jgi:DNA-binding NtrC family response regulator